MSVAAQAGAWAGASWEPPGTQAGRAVAGPEGPFSRSRAIDDKYSRREEYRGFTQDFKEKDGYKPDVKIEYVDETGRKLTPKEVSRAGSDRVTERQGPCPSHPRQSCTVGLGSADRWLGSW